MANEMFTQLPGVVNSTLADIICAVQAGVSTQQTLGQVITLAMQTAVLNYPGNPNSHVAGTLYQQCWDSTDSLMFVCTTAGNAGTAVWTPIVGQLTNGQVLIGSTGATPVKGTISAGTNISIANAAGTITISATG